MPNLSAIIPNQWLFVHGGISSKIVNLDSLRFPTLELEQQILWNDPTEERGERRSRRGIGKEFGEDVTDEVMKRLGVKQIVRSHQPYLAKEAPHFNHSGKVMTISSTRAYDYGSVLSFQPHFLEIKRSKDKYFYSVR